MKSLDQSFLDDEGHILYLLSLWTICLIVDLINLLGWWCHGPAGWIWPSLGFTFFSFGFREHDPIKWPLVKSWSWTLRIWILSRSWQFPSLHGWWLMHCRSFYFLCCIRNCHFHNTSERNKNAKIWHMPCNIKLPFIYNSTKKKMFSNTWHTL